MFAKDQILNPTSNAVMPNVTVSDDLEERLRIKTEELEMLVSSLDGIVLHYDPDGKLKRIWCHDEKLLKQLPGDYLGKSLQDAFVLMPAFTAPFIEDFEKATRLNETCCRDFMVSHENEINWYNSQIFPLFHPDGSVKGCTQRITDISEKKKAELDIEEQNSQIRFIHKESELALRISEERYRSLFDALGEGIVLIDSNGSIIACNSSAERLFGASKEQLLLVNTFESLSTFFHEDGSPFPLETHPSYLTLKTGQSFQEVVLGLYKSDGSLCWISLNTEPIYYSEHRLNPDAVVASFVDITQAKKSKAELLRSEQQLREYSSRITNILNSITDGFIALDNQLNVLMWNNVVEMATGIKTEDAIGKNISGLFPDIINAEFYPTYVRALKKQEAVVFEHYYPPMSMWFEASIHPSAEGLFIYFRDITQRKKQQKLLALEKDVLEINAQPSSSLKHIVDYFLEGLENIFPGMSCSVITLNIDRKKMSHLSAPTLPADFSAEINGRAIGENVGSCGKAMSHRKMVITHDIYNDPCWDNYHAIASQFGLRACWSFPIINAKNEVLATIAAYFKETKSPTEIELNIFERVSNLLRIIIENKRAEAAVRLSNERYLLATKATNDALWDHDLPNEVLYWGDGFYNLLGYRPDEVESSLEFWASCLHPDDRKRVVEKLVNFIDNKSPGIWHDEYQFRNSEGVYLLIYDRGFLIFNQDGNINRMVGSMQDITEKRELEKKLLKQELDKQTMVAQAVVDAQEKERADIGHELHDNVNQILSTTRLYLELASNDEKERVNLINKGVTHISSAINEIRNISRSLVPASIGDLGLIASVQDLVENVQLTKTLHVEFYHEGEIEKKITDKRKLMLFRIIQEQVTNVLKHSEAKNLVIEMVVDETFIHLSISDNGKGFDKEKIKNKKGVGLHNIASRAELFNGTIDMVTEPGKGCKLNIHIPV